MKQSFCLPLLGIAALSLSLTGCGLDQFPAYSAKVKYGVRKDPILRAPAAKLGDERYDPDRPGVFPLMKFEEIANPEHPYHAKIAEINDTILRDVAKIPQNYRDEIEKILDGLYGTPANPTVNVKDTAKVDDDDIRFNEENRDALKLDDATLAKGSTRYRVHCLHCHGVPGDGRGPTARWINPHPRDFRGMMFKFQSVDRTGASSFRPPARADLMRTLREGIEGTAMPSFVLLSDDDREAIISYVIHLSLRGKVEAMLLDKGFDYDAKKEVFELASGVNLKEDAKFYAGKYAKAWLDSNDPSSAIKVAEFPFDDTDMKNLAASVQRGQQIFNATPSAELKKDYRERIHAIEFPKKLAEAGGDKDKAEKLLDEQVMNKLTAIKCVTCHVDYGRQAKFRFDEWGTLVQPRNLPQGLLRGGKRPVDIYYRIHSGIPGSEMTPFGGPTALGGQEQYIWDLVNFVKVLPYPAMHKQLGLKLD